MRLLGALVVFMTCRRKRGQGPCGPGHGELTVPEGHILKGVSIMPIPSA